MSKYDPPAIGATIALTVKKCLTLCTGSHTHGICMRMKRKNPTKSLVVVPEEAGIEFGRLL
jgi:hypothetical protein